MDKPLLARVVLVVVVVMGVIVTGPLQAAPYEAMEYLNRLEDCADADVVECKVAAFKLSQFGDEVVQDLLEILEGSDITEETRLLIIMTLKEIDTPKSTSALMEIYALAPSNALKVMIVSIMAERDFEVIVPFLTLIINDSNPAIRTMAASSLGKYAGEKSVAALLVLIDDGNVDVAEAAIRSLGMIGSDKIVGKLVAKLSSKEPRLVVAAIQALRFIGESKVATSLVPLLEHSDSSVRLEAEGALKVLTGKDLGKDAQAWKQAL